MDVLAGDGVLLDAERGDGEAVDDVLRVEVEIDLATGGQDEGRGEDVVDPARVGGVDAEGIAGAGVGEARLNAAEGVVRAGIAEVPGELHASGFYLERGGVGAGVAGGSPQALGAQGEEREEEGEGSQREVFDEGGAAVVPRGGVVGAAADEEPGEEDEVREKEQADGDPEVEGEMAVERGAVRGGVGRHEPGDARQDGENRHWGEDKPSGVSNPSCRLLVGGAAGGHFGCGPAGGDGFGGGDDLQVFG